MFTEEEKRIVILSLQSAKIDAEIRQLEYDRSGIEYDRSILNNTIQQTTSAIDKVSKM